MEGPSNDKMFCKARAKANYAAELEREHFPSDAYIAYKQACAEVSCIMQQTPDDSEKNALFYIYNYWVNRCTALHLTIIAAGSAGWKAPDTEQRSRGSHRRDPKPEAWVINSGALYHVCGDRTRFHTYKETPGLLYSNFGEAMLMSGTGNVSVDLLPTDGRKVRIVLSNVVHASVNVNQISVAALAKEKSAEIHFKEPFSNSEILINGRCISLLSNENVPYKVHSLHEFTMLGLPSNTVAPIHETTDFIPDTPTTSEEDENSNPSSDGAAKP